MIDLKVKGQELTLTHPVIVADTRDYIELSLITEGPDWEGCRTWAHFERDGIAFSEEFIEGNILKDKHVRLDAGTWKICVTGEKGTTLITTEQVGLPVRKTGTFDGAPFPPVGPSDTEKLMKAVEGAVSTAQSVRDDADAGLFKGDKGDKGDVGPVGPQGDTGLTGPEGPQGPQSEAGHTPVKGVDYYTNEERIQFEEDVLAQTYTKGYIDGHFASAIKPTVKGNPLVLSDTDERPAIGFGINGTTQQSPIRHLTAPVITADKVTGGQTAPTRCESVNLIDVPRDFSFNIKNMNVDISAGTYTISSEKATRGGTNSIYLTFENSERVHAVIPVPEGSSKTINLPEKTLFMRFYSNGYGYQESLNVTSSITGLMLNKGTSPKPYTPYISDFSGVTLTVKQDDTAVATYTPQADGTVLGVQTIDGNMTVLTDTEGVDVDMIVPEPIVNADVSEITNTDGADRGFIQSLSQRYSLSKWDRIFKDIDGAWKVEKQTGNYTFDGIKPFDYSGKGRAYMIVPDIESRDFADSSTKENTECMLDTFEFSKGAWNGNTEGFVHNGKIVVVCNPKYFTSMENAKKWLQNNPILIHYKSDTPTTTPLPQEDGDILDRIATYYPNTVVQTDGGILTLKYVADLLNYIDGRYAKSTEHTDAQVMSLRADTDDKIADVQALALER